MKVYSKIAGTGSSFPKTFLRNSDMEKSLNTDDLWITNRVGINERKIASHVETTHSLGTLAAESAIKMAGIQANDIGLIIASTTTPGYHFPSLACILQKNLSITNECPAFDINSACSGFIYAINIADKYIKSCAIEYALIVCSDILSRVVNWERRSSCVLFGDGSGAVVLKSSNEPGLLYSSIKSDGQFSNMLYSENKIWNEKYCYNKSLYMKGSEVFRNAVSKLEKTALESLEKTGLKKEDINWLIPHQANIHIIYSIYLLL